MMTPGDFASLQEGREGLNTEDYFAWKLPHSEEDDSEDYPFPLTLRNKRPSRGSFGGSVGGNANGEEVNGGA